MSKILIVNHTSPYSGLIAQESLDMALAFSAFEHEVSLAFLGDGVFQLLKDQAPASLQQKNLVSAFHLLESEGIHNLWIEATALKIRGLLPEQLWSPHHLATPEQLQQMMAESDHVFHF